MSISFDQKWPFHLGDTLVKSDFCLNDNFYTGNQSDFSLRYTSLNFKKLMQPPHLMIWLPPSLVLLVNAFPSYYSLMVTPYMPKSLFSFHPKTEFRGSNPDMTWNPLTARLFGHLITPIIMYSKGICITVLPRGKALFA